MYPFRDVTCVEKTHPVQKSNSLRGSFQSFVPKQLLNSNLVSFSGLKDTLFDEYLIEDAVYLLVALALISFSILFYTR